MIYQIKNSATEYVGHCCWGRLKGPKWWTIIASILGLFSNSELFCCRPFWSRFLNISSECKYTLFLNFVLNKGSCLHGYYLREPFPNSEPFCWEPFSISKLFCRRPFWRRLFCRRLFCLRPFYWQAFLEFPHIPHIVPKFTKFPTSTGGGVSGGWEFFPSFTMFEFWRLP